MTGSPRLAIIGGTGLEKFIDAEGRYYKETLYGQVGYTFGYVGDVEVIFIPRHGFKHEYPPHKVPYKAIIDLIAANDIDKIIGFSAVGSLRYDLKPGDIVIPTQIIDFSKHRETFYGFNAYHVDFTYPYCMTLGLEILKALNGIGLDVKYGYTYVSTYGPRFESSAEINMLRRVGADIVGMTNIPESVLAREAGIHYVLISIVSNYAAGMQRRVSAEEVYDVMSKVEPILKKALRSIISSIKDVSPEDSCIAFKNVYREYREVGG